MKNQKILIIDDDPDYLESIKIFLKEANFQVLTASDGSIGLSKAELMKPDLIILDIMLPDTDGYSVCRELKEKAETGNIPIIILSNISTQTQGKGYANKIAFYHRADDFIEKPVTKDVLLKRIEILLNKRAQVLATNKEKSKILIVDDDPDFVSGVEKVLEVNNLDVFVADNGVEALKMSKAFHPDLILLDIMLPGKDGYTVCHELKKDSKTHNIPIILVSAIGKEMEKPEFASDIAIEHGADDFIEKPISAGELLKSFNKYIKI